MSVDLSFFERLFCFMIGTHAFSHKRKRDGSRRRMSLIKLKSKSLLENLMENFARNVYFWIGCIIMKKP